MSKTNEKKVLVLSAIAVITLIAVVAGATYAYFQAQGGGSSDIDASVITSTTDKLSTIALVVYQFLSSTKLDRISYGLMIYCVLA